MKLKKLIYNVSLFAVGLTLAACSDIAEDDRFEYVEPAEVAKRVLIEDFTGQRCVQCPDGTAKIEQLIADYGEDNIIAVGLYGGAMGFLPNGGPAMPLTCDESQWYYTTGGVDQSPQPIARIDRGDFNFNRKTWATAVYDRLQLKAPLSLDATCNYDEASRNVEITINADIVQNVTVDSLGNVIIDSPDVVDGKLQVWLTEDSIVSVQAFPSGNDKEYVHNHVFRASVNDLAGESFVLNRGETTKRTFTYTVSEDWKPEDMSVVTFVFNDSGVLQAAKAPLIPKAEEPGTGEGGESEGGDEAE